MTDALPKALDLILRGMEDGLHIGAGLYVSVEGKLAAHYALGEASSGVLLTHSASCPWLSAGKPFTAAAIAWLWERKLLKMDDRVAKYIPAFAAGGKESITIRHCLTHQAGIRDAVSAWSRQSHAEIMSQICQSQIEPGWVVGKTAGYHVASTWYLLGEIVREVSTRPLDTFLREQIFSPLGMLGARLVFTPEEWAAIAPSRMVMQMLGMAASHAASGAASWENEEIFSIPRPGSGIRAAVQDVGRFYEYLIGQGPAADKPVLSPTTRAALTARHRVGEVDLTFKAKVDWGLGFVCDSAHYGQLAVPYQYGPHASPRAFGHGGNQSSVGMADPEHKLVIALIFNGMCGAARHDQRQRAILAAIYEDLGLIPGVSVIPSSSLSM